MRLIPDHVWAELTIWMEARGEPYDGQCAVAEVIWTRMLRRYTSDGTVPGTVLAPYQFSCWNTDDRQRLRAAMLEDTDAQLEMCRQAWNDVRAGRSVVPGAMLYLNPDLVHRLPSWADQAKEVARIGRHVFYLP